MKALEPIRHMLNNGAFIQDVKDIQYMLGITTLVADDTFKADLDYLLHRPGAGITLQLFREQFHSSLPEPFAAMHLNALHAFILATPEPWKEFIETVFKLPGLVDIYDKAFLKLAHETTILGNYDNGLHMLSDIPTVRPNFNRSSLALDRLKLVAKLAAVTRAVDYIVTFHQNIIAGEKA